MAAIFDHDFAAEVETMLRADLAHSEVLEKTLEEQPLWLRGGARVARLTAPVL